MVRWHILTLVGITALAGCQRPFVYHAYAPAPVDAQGVHIAVREVHRGRQGGVMVLDVSNHTSNPVARLSGADVWLQRDDGSSMRALSAQEFAQWVTMVGPKQMGFKHWPPKNASWQLESIGQGRPLPPGTQTTIAVGFVLPRDDENLTVALQPAVCWAAPSPMVQPAHHVASASPNVSVKTASATVTETPAQAPNPLPPTTMPSQPVVCTPPPTLPSIRVTLPKVPDGPCFDDISKHIDVGVAVGGRF